MPTPFNTNFTKFKVTKQEMLQKKKIISIAIEKIMFVLCA